MKKAILVTVLIFLFALVAAQAHARIRRQSCPPGQFVIAIDEEGTIECDSPTCVPEVCDDEIDNDCDGDIDEQDSDCQVCVPIPEICDDGIDNDCDGATDNDDSDCVAGCVDDQWEENDNQGQATSFSSLPANGDGVSVSGDSDWFSFQLGSAQGVDISVLFTHSLGDIDIFLYDNSGTLLASSESVTDDENISYVVSSSGTYYIEVRMISSESCNDYSIIIN